VVPPADIDEEKYQDFMLSDKKTRGGKLTFILLKGIGNAVIETEINSELLSQTLRAQDQLCQL
jgi:3-dehydroquinate synthase